MRGGVDWRSGAVPGRMLIIDEIQPHSNSSSSMIYGIDGLNVKFLFFCEIVSEVILYVGTASKEV